MYIVFKNIHHYVGMLTLVFVLLLTVVSFIYYIQGRNTTTQLRKISLLTMIFTHTQVVIGLIVFFISPIFQNTSMKDIMGTSIVRRNYIEHPFTMIIVAILLTLVNLYIKKAEKLPIKVLVMSAISLAAVIGMIPRTFWSTLLP